MLRLPAAALAACCLALAACGGSSDEDEIRDVVADFTDAVRDRDADKFCDAVTSEQIEQGSDEERDKAIDECKSQLGDAEFEEIGEVDGVEVSGIEVDGDSATATVKASVGGEEEEDEATFRKIGDDWKIAVDE